MGMQPSTIHYSFLLVSFFTTPQQDIIGHPFLCICGICECKPRAKNTDQLDLGCLGTFVARHSAALLRWPIRPGNGPRKGPRTWQQRTKFSVTCQRPEWAAIYTIAILSSSAQFKRSAAAAALGQCSCTWAVPVRARASHSSHFHEAAVGRRHEAAAYRL